MLPGICLCVAPGVSADADVMYSLYPQGFLAGSGISTNDPIFFDSGGSPMMSGTASVRTNGPIARIEFFMQAAFVGRYSGSTASPMPMASALYMGKAIPSNTGLSSDFSDFLDAADNFRGNGSNFAAWYQNLSAVMRGTMNLAVLSYLVFPSR